MESRKKNFCKEKSCRRCSGHFSAELSNAVRVEEGPVADGWIGGQGDSPLIDTSSPLRAPFWALLGREKKGGPGDRRKGNMALSSRAHAFSVDVLMGNANPTKRKLKDLEEDLSSETRTEKVSFRRSQAPGKPRFFPALFPIEST